MEKALEGVKILDFTWIAAGPLTTIPFAKFGAFVLKVESSKKPDGVRTSPPYLKGKAGLGRSLQFSNDNADKYSVSINTKTPEGQALIFELVKWADVVIENMRPGAMDRMGFGYEKLKEVNPSIIMFRSSMAGQTGPESKLGATGTELQGYCGFTSVTGYPGDPIPPWCAYTDMVVPAIGIGMLAGALDYRRRTGKGQMIDLSQLEASLQFLGTAFVDYFATGHVQHCKGNMCDFAAPHGCYRCAGEDNWCTIACFTDEEWNACVNVMGNPAWASDPKFATLVGRKKHEEELNRNIEAWTSDKDRLDIMQMMQAAGVEAGYVETAEDLLNEPQMLATDFLKVLDVGDGCTMSHMGQAFQLSKTPYKTTRTGPQLGEHTDYVCQNILHMDDERFVDLFSKGVFE